MRIVALLFFLISLNALGATCTTTTRSNYSTGQVLTSSALNADFNQLVTKANAFDAGCLTDGTLEKTALNSTDFAAVTSGIHQGCGLAWIDASTVGVGKCILSVNGNFVKTTTQNNVAMGCDGCSPELVSTTYYVYAKSGSSGTTLNLIISSTAPDADGYDGSGNKVLGKFLNDSASAIDQTSIMSWTTNFFALPGGGMSIPGVSAPARSFMFSFGDTNATTVCASNPCTYLDKLGTALTQIALTGAGTYTATLSGAWTKIKCNGNVIGGFPAQMTPVSALATSTTFTFQIAKISDGTPLSGYGTIHCEGY